MRTYLNLLQQVLGEGSFREDRTGVGTYSLFGAQARYSLKEHFPLLTTKKVHLKSIIHELLWFLRGDTNVKSLNEVGVTIWDEWADQSGELGPVYGAQWVRWEGPRGQVINQIQRVIEQIKRDPFSRRHIVSAWNPAQVDEMALPPCHTLFQFYVSTDKRLSCQLYQRSADIFLGVPFNIASYSLLTLMVAQVCGLKPGDFVHSFGDLHLYQNHVAQAKLQLSRTPGMPPKMRLNTAVTRIEDFRYEDFTLEDYHPQPGIKAPIAV